MTVHPLPRHDGTIFTCSLPGGARIQALVIGSGSRPAVFVHGLGGAPDQSQPLLRLIAEQYDLRIYALWLPNHGPSSDVRTYEGVVTAITEWVDYLGLQKVPWIGESIGAFFALDVAVRRPDQVSSVLTIAPPVADPHDRRPLSYWYISPRVAVLGAEAVAVTAANGLYAFWSGTGLRFGLTMLRYFVNPPRLYWAVKVVHEAPDLLPQLAGLADHSGIPVVHLFGQWDLVVPPPKTPLPGHTIIAPYGLHCSLLAPWSPTVAAVIAAAGRSMAKPVAIPERRPRGLRRPLPA